MVKLIINACYVWPKETHSITYIFLSLLSVLNFIKNCKKTKLNYKIYDLFCRSQGLSNIYIHNVCLAIVNLKKKDYIIFSTIIWFARLKAYFGFREKSYSPGNPRFCLVRDRKIFNFFK